MASKPWGKVIPAACGSSRTVTASPLTWGPASGLIDADCWFAPCRLTSNPTRSETIGAMAPSKQNQPTPLDDTDRRIVHLLQQDGRMSMRDLAAAVHVSLAHVYTRVRRLPDDRVSKRFKEPV